VQPNQQFLRQPKSFWACVRTLSQAIGYTQRGTGRIKVPSPAQMRDAFGALGLNETQLAEIDGNATELGDRLHAYFQYRANVLNDHVRGQLMNLAQARAAYDALVEEHNPTCPVPMNKQKGEKKAPAYLTGMVNIMIEAHAGGMPCNYDPRELTTITVGGVPIRTLARRVDGAFPSAVNPVAVWEIKEYYYTTTFGSRVADGVYETLLDGMELEELREHESVDVRHYLMADAYRTWWDDGRSYLCRMVDMLHMGYVDEILFGREVVTELPRIVREWAQLVNAREA
jgi:hypothetical protein